MKNSKDLNWLSAPAFILILGIMLLNAIKQPRNAAPLEKVRVENHRK
jgi:hypothetical protein